MHAPTEGNQQKWWLVDIFSPPPRSNRSSRRICFVNKSSIFTHKLEFSAGFASPGEFKQLLIVLASRGWGQYLHTRWINYVINV